MKIKVFLMILFFAAAWPMTAMAEIPINPITPEVKDRLRESIKLVSTVEDKMAPSVTDLEKIMKSYEPCKSKEKDRGCVEIKKQLGEKYKEVLDALGEQIPKVKSAVNSTADNLGLSIRNKTRRKEVRQLWEEVAKKKSIPRPKRDKPLSKKLYTLLEALGPGSNMSILELSLQTQADLITSAEIIEYIEARVQHLSMIVDMGQELPIMSEEMAAVMQGVSELFGFDMNFAPEIPETPVQAEGITGEDWR